MRLIQFTTLLLSLLLAACTSGQAGPVISSGERYSATDTQVEDYRLGAGDKLRLNVFNEQDLSGEFAVNANGSLSLPLIGDIPVVGKQVDEVATLIQQKLAEGYVREPKVSIEITTYRPFFILGEVRQPGQYAYAAGMTVTNAIALAQGFTPRAVQGTVMIRRAGSSSEEAYKIAPDLRVWPGDTIRINERYF